MLVLRQIVDLSKVFDILDRFFQSSDTIDVTRQESIKRDLSINVGFSVHIARLVVLFLVAEHRCLSLSQYLANHAVRDFKCNFTDDAVFSLGVRSTIKEHNSF